MVLRFSGILLIITLFGCGKDTFDTKPTITFKQINSSEIGVNSRLEIILEYTDKEGDLGGGELQYFRNRLNIKPPPSTGDKADTVPYPLAEFPDRTRGEIQVNISYAFMDEDPNDNDTMKFLLTVRDKMGNFSDTIESPIVVARQQ